jgi:phospholipid/cholesterol/gamma-HCH transport system substrate-binding protein
MLKPGAILQNTQGAVDLMGLVGRFINSGSGSGPSGNNHSAPKPASPLPGVP